MKNLSLLTLLLVLVACGGDEKVDVSELIASGDTAALTAERDRLADQQAQLQTDLKKLNEALEAKNPNNKLPLITAMAVKDTVYNHYIELQGNLDTEQNVVIYPEYQGTLTRVLVNEGDRVRKGQTLARIDDGGLSSQVAQLEAQAALAKTTFDRQKRLWDQNIGSEIQYLQAETQYTTARNAVQQLRRQLGKTTVTAPFSGTVDEIFTEQGTVVAPGVMLMRLVNPGDMFVEAQVPERYSASVKVGTNVNVVIPVLGDTLSTKIKQAGTFINPANRSFTIELDVPNKDNNLKPNMSARLAINDYSNDKAILLPLNVISENAEGQQYVYVVTQQGDKQIAKRRIITTGLSQGELIEAKTGLKPGDQVVVEGARSVKDGQEVRILEY